ncbi:ABC transporter ATP-binding protein [Candidatus Methylospira mobilis]|uniref:ABC transporter ATP-binding protein n=1 Tax=Candidatus Methylospira mobilis TaxID=1808979 RepID=A0A5Q0BIS1_9GAMM|nr:ABC transporter ATP-binding protein [Candidatus Methylospira mobilis]QFY43720.1 ABC transporter ATP-binding protein [Candidatus Methylospira mobilis]
MSAPVIQVTSTGKKFCRSFYAAFGYALQDSAAALIRLPPRKTLRRHEFWAVQDISFAVARGECLAIIGPNGAGKSTLLKLINREYRPDAGSVLTRAPVKSMIRIGSGLQPMLSGRENIYIQCAQLGLSKRETDALIQGIVAFAELDEAIDAPVKTYSDGMYARLDFSIATSVCPDILLVDEVLAVGDIAFQMRCLDRLNQLKAEGAAIIFVSHSEMNVRHVADRCLLLFNGKQLGVGSTDALFAAYYASIGYINRSLQAEGALLSPPPDCGGDVEIHALTLLRTAQQSGILTWGEPLELAITYSARMPLADAVLHVQFRNSAGILIASADTAMNGFFLTLARGSGCVTVSMPRILLAPGLYRLSVQLLEVEGRLLASQGNMLEIHVGQGQATHYCGLVALEAEFKV